MNLNGKYKKILIYAVPVLVVSAVFVAFIVISREGRIDISSSIGNREESPLKAAAPSSKAYEIQETFRKIFDLYKDSVVFVNTEQLVRVQPYPMFSDPFMREFFGQGLEQGPQIQMRKGFGSGFIVSEDGYICTNHHVIAGVDKVSVKINNRVYDAAIVGSDSNTDIALLKIRPREKLKPVYLGDSDEVRVGDWAIAIGNPFGLDRTFTVGVVSAIGRNDVDLMGGSHIQTDASINPGNSGGPLISITGEVIGINRMIYSRSGGYMGIGFAIPVNTAKTVLSQLKLHRRITRGYIGISVAQISDNYAKQLGLEGHYGAFVGSIVQNSPADSAGMMVGDVIVKVNDKDIDSFKDLLIMIEKAPVGSTIKITALRSRSPMHFYVQVAVRPRLLDQ
ncbi:MAG: trypsin-like peptidase domain-containing protein [Spirochaetes bacterium]|nr:trypsin-like peptidase domain-containing protein [Spirochaetota bacterium]